MIWNDTILRFIILHFPSQQNQPLKKPSPPPSTRSRKLKVLMWCSIVSVWKPQCSSHISMRCCFLGGREIAYPYETIWNHISWKLIAFFSKHPTFDVQVIQSIRLFTFYLFNHVDPSKIQLFPKVMMTTLAVPWPCWSLAVVSWRLAREAFGATSSDSVTRDVWWVFGEMICARV